MKTILVPLDGSALAEQVLPYATLLAATLSARLHLLRAIPDVYQTNTLIYEPITPFESEGAFERQREHTLRTAEIHTQNAEHYLAAQAERLRDAGFDAVYDVRVGPTAEIIVELARAEQAYCIAMATHGYGGLQRLALGSITDKVIRTTSTPVLVVRAGVTKPAGLLTLKRILVPLDGSELAQQALPIATDLAAQSRTELLLLYAIENHIEALTTVPNIGNPLRQLLNPAQIKAEEMSRRLNTQATELRRAQVPVTTLVEINTAADAIIDQAGQYEADLIIMATHGCSGLRRWTLGSVTNKVLRAADIPLLLVRTHSHN